MSNRSSMVSPGAQTRFFVAFGEAGGSLVKWPSDAHRAEPQCSFFTDKTLDGRPDKLLYGSNGIAALALPTVTIEPTGK